MNYETLEQNIDNMIVVLDTNILLYLYKCSSSTCNDILRLLNKTKENIVVPAQVEIEFNKHKCNEQAKVSKKYDNFEKELAQKVRSLENKLKERITEAKKYNFPKCNDLEEKINAQIDLLKTEIHQYSLEIATEKAELIKNSQITGIDKFVSYLTINNKIRKELDFRKHLEFIKEGELRYKYCIPPGYEDGKDKVGIDKFGDLFIWKEILEIGKENKDKYIIFLTNDCKEDWWVLKGENKQCDRMRDELRKEFIDEAQNNRIEL
jgi:predicted nucleic acid-binding protein